MDERGLSYNIRIEDNFTSELNSFRKLIKDIKKEVSSLTTNINGLNKSLSTTSTRARNAATGMDKLSRSVAKLGSESFEKVEKLSRAMDDLAGNTKRAADEAKTGFKGTSKDFSNTEAAVTKTANSMGILASDTKRARQELDKYAQVARSIRTFTAAPGIGAGQRGIGARPQRLIEEQEFIIEGRLANEIQKANVAMGRFEKSTEEAAEASRRLRIEQKGFADASARRASTGIFSAAGAQTAKRNVADLEKGLKNLNTQTAGLNSSFTTLFRLIATTVVLRSFVESIRRLTGLFTEFNSVIEQSRLGIASLLSASGTISDPFGNVLTGADALETSLLIAEEQTKKLRVEALKTAATYEELLEAFQVSVAPGLTAGLDIDEIRKFTVQVSQAASALGLSQNQLAEEIRSLLQGTINPRNTRIAVALGISNEDIRNAKEAGELTDFLTSRFDAFTRSAEKLQNTFAGLFARVKGALEIVIATGAVTFFEELKDVLREVVDILVSEADGDIFLNPDTVAIIREVSDGLSSILATVREIAQEQGFSGFLEVAELLSTFLASSASALLGFFQGLLQVAIPLANAFSEFETVLNDIGISIADLGKAAGIITGIAVAVKTLSGVVVLLSVGIARLNTQLALLGTVGPKGLAALAVRAAFLLPLIVGIAKAIENVNSETRGLDLGIWDSLRLAVIQVYNGVTLLLAGIINLVTIPLEQAVKQLELLASAIRALAEFTGVVDKANNSFKDVENNIKLFKEGLKDFRDELNKNTIDGAIDRFDAFINGSKEGKKAVDSLATSVIDLLRIGTVTNSTASALSDISEQIKSIEEAGFSASSALAELLQSQGSAEASDFMLGFGGRELEELQKLIVAQDKILNSFGQAEVDADVSALNEVARVRLNSQREILRISTEISQTEEKVLEFRKLEERTSENVLKAREAVLDTSLTLEERQDKVNKLIGQDVLANRELETLLRQQAESVGKLEVLQQQKLEVQEQEGRLVDLVTERITQQAEVRRRIFLRDQRQQALVQKVQLESLNEETRIRRELEEGVITSRQAEIQAISNQTVAQQRLSEIELERLENTIALQKEKKRVSEEDQNASSQEALDIQKVIDSLEEELKLRQDISAAQQQQALDQQRILQAREDSPISEGIREGIREASEFDTFEDTLAATTQLIEGFSNASGDALAAMFERGESAAIAFRNTMADVLRDIARLLAQSAIRNLFASLASGGTSAGGVGAGAGASAGVNFGSFNSGGLVPSSAAVGSVPGIHPADTVPAMLTPNEFVMRNSAVAKYGTTIMEALNRGLVSPSLLTSLVKGKAVKTSKPLKRGYNTGGQVSTTMGRTQTNNSGLVMPANESTMEALIQGGRRTFDRYVQENTSQTTRRGNS